VLFRQKSSGAEGERLKEATNINKSLSTLGLVDHLLVYTHTKKMFEVCYELSAGISMHYTLSKIILVYDILADLSLQTSLLCRTKNHTMFPIEIQN